MELMSYYSKPKGLPRGKPIQKGEVLNPEGGRVHDPTKRALRKLTKEQLTEVMELILQTDPAHLNAETKVEPTVLKQWVASAAAKGIQKGDLSALGFILDRTIGRVKEQIEVTGANGTPFGSMSDEELKEKIKKNLETMKLLDG